MTGEVHDTVRAYDLDALAYAGAGAQFPDSVRADIEELAARLGSGARVLEIGSGGGRDARLMEELGLSVRRTDITPAFVTLLRSQGHDADVVSGTGWSDVDVRSGIDGRRAESWLELGAVRG